MNGQDIGAALSERVRAAHASGTPLEICGSGSKRFYGRSPRGENLSVREHHGTVAYEPSELVIRARSGTPLSEIERLLASEQQMLPFEPPHFGPAATLGGCIAAGLSGPRRMQAGAVRDSLLGAEIINGRGERLRFGGQVMKNVAGYDMVKPMAGALGTLGVLCEISLRVIPKPEVDITLARSASQQEALALLQGWANQPLPISATLHESGALYLRLSGSEAAVKAARAGIGGDELDWGETFWITVREQRLPFFLDEAPLWRLSLPPAAALPDIDGEWLIEWGGAQRWLKSRLPALEIRTLAATAGGHATLFRGGDREGEVFTPLPPPMQALQARLKGALDPTGILNPGRLYPDI